MKLYTSKLSPYSAKIRVALDEKGVAFEEIALPTRRAGIVEKPRELLEANPRGQVPVLVDGDLRLHDSTVILEYLEERYPDPPLYPRELRARARARLLEDTGDWLQSSAVAALLAETFRKPDPATRDAARLAEIAAALHQGYTWLERQIEGPFLCGAFGAADVSCYIPVTFAAFFGVPPGAEHPRLASLAGAHGRAAERAPRGGLDDRRAEQAARLSAAPRTRRRRASATRSPSPRRRA